jgi:hypothetical protein
MRMEWQEEHEVVARVSVFRWAAGVYTTGPGYSKSEVVFLRPIRSQSVEPQKTRVPCFLAGAALDVFVGELAIFDFNCGRLLLCILCRINRRLFFS